MKTLCLVLKRIESEDKTTYDNFYSHSKAETIINESENHDNVFKLIYTTLTSEYTKIFQKMFRQNYWFSHTVEHNIHILKCTPLDESSYINLPK